VAIRQDGTGDILNLLDGATEVLTVTDGGKVGIGTATPAAKVEIEVADSEDLGGLHIDLNETGVHNALVVDSESTNSHTAIIRGKYGAKIEQDISSGYALLVERDIAEAGSWPLAHFHDDNTSNSQTTMKIQQDGTGDILNLFDGATEVLTVTDGGKVGLGVAAPSAVLEVRQEESTTLTDFTQAVSKAGILINVDYTSDAYTPGLYWNTEDNNPTKPKAGVYMKETSTGTYLYLGTSNHYATGITTNTIIDPDGNLTVVGDLQVDGGVTKARHVFNLGGSVSSAPTGGYYLPWVSYSESQSISANTISAMRNSLIAPYDGKFLTVMVSSEGSGTEAGVTVVGVHKNHDTTAMETQSINISAFSTTYTATFTSNTFSKGDVLHVNLDATNSLDYVMATVVLEFDEST